MAQQFTAEEIAAYITRQFGHEAPGVAGQVNEWLARGDGIAVYENTELGIRDAGASKLVSFGSPDAQLEVSEPPANLPDTDTEINWRYLLYATYQGEQLPIPPLVPRNDGTPDAIPLDAPVAVNPRIVAYTVALDNHEPTRKHEHGTLKEYDDPNDFYGPRYLRPVLCSDIADSSIFIIDDGARALPYYGGSRNPGQLKSEDIALISTLNPAAWERMPFEILMPFPVNPDGRMAGGEPGSMWHTPRVIDFTNWMLGPRKCYHLKVKR